MKLNVAQCRSAKKIAAPGGLRRSNRNSTLATSYVSLAQQQNLGEICAGVHCQPLSTIPSPLKFAKQRASHCRQGKTRQGKKVEVPETASLSFQDSVQKQLVKERSFKLEALVEGQLCRKNSLSKEYDGALTTMLARQRSFNEASNMLARQTSFNEANNMLTRQKSFIQDNSVLTKQRSFHLEGSIGACLSRQSSFQQDNTGLVKQRSFRLETSDGACLSRQTSLKIEALIEPRVLSRTSSCTTIGRKRVVGVDDFADDIDITDCLTPSLPSNIWEPDFSPRKKFASPRTPSTCLDRSPSASLTLSELECTPRWKVPSTIASQMSYCHNLNNEEYGGESQLEELPFDLLLRIVCCLKHDDVQAVSLVCKRLMQAVSIAQRYHFCFTTPHREKKGKSSQIYLSDDEMDTSKGRLAEKFIRPPTPNAPKHGVRPAEKRLSQGEAYLFTPGFRQLESPPQEGAHARKSLNMVMGRRTTGSTGTHRALFDEDELCEAVAHNSL